jgi:hypothetical protein
MPDAVLASEEEPGETFAAEVITHPAAEPVEERVLEPAFEMASGEPPPPAAEPMAALAYEPDQERREKFFSRLSRWAKKN